MLKDWTLFEKSWLVISVSIITVLGLLWDDTLLGMISSITGIICVVLVAKGKISSYFFGVIQAGTYGYLAMTQYGLLGEGYLNLFFFLPLQFVGFYVWIKNKKSNEEAVNGEDIYAKRLDLKQWTLLTVIVIVGYIICAMLLRNFGANLAGLDGLAVVLSVVAQVLMVLRYAEQWILWILINVITIILWGVVLVQTGGNDWTVFVMWCAFLVNSIYGYINWLKISKETNATTYNLKHFG